MITSALTTVLVPTLDLTTVNCYQGPLLDRIDIHIEVPRVDYEKLSAGRAGSEKIQSVHLAEALQYRPKLMIV